MVQLLFFAQAYQVGDWTITIHSQRGNTTNSKKHVHITKKKLSGEYSWNLDGSRHDKHKFPYSEQCIEAAKKHAAEALGIPKASFSLIGGMTGGQRISLRSNTESKYDKMALFNSYVSKNLTLIFFGTPNGLVLVIQECLEDSP